MNTNSNTAIVTNIQWDADNKEDIADLNTSTIIILPDALLGDEDLKDFRDNVSEYVSDEISNMFGFTHTGFDLEIKINEPVSLEEAELLIGQTIDVLENSETQAYKGTVIKVSENVIDGILVSVLDQDDNCFDIEIKSIELITDEEINI